MCVHYLYIHVHAPRAQRVCVVYVRVCIGNAHTHNVRVCTTYTYTYIHHAHTHHVRVCVQGVCRCLCIFMHTPCTHTHSVCVHGVCTSMYRYVRVCIAHPREQWTCIISAKSSRNNHGQTIDIHLSRYSIINTLSVCVHYLYINVHTPRTHKRMVCAWCMSCMYKSCTHAQCASVCITYTYTTHAHSCVCVVYARVCIGMYVYVLHILANNECVLSRPNVVVKIMVKRLTYTIPRTRFSTLSRRTCWKRRTYIVGVWGTAEIH